MVDTWDTISTTWTTETRTWRELLNFVVEQEDTFSLTFLLSDVVQPKVWTPQTAVSNSWTPQTEL